MTTSADEEVMTETEYIARREALIVRQRGERAALLAEFRAAAMGRRQARRAKLGEVDAVVRAAIARAPRRFTVRDVAADPDVAPHVRYRSTVSAVLIRMAREGDLVLVRAGAGPHPAVYQRVQGK